MITREKHKEQTCWGIMLDVLSKLTPSKLIVGYLYISGQILNNFVSAQEMVKQTYYRHQDGHFSESQLSCVNASPGCTLSVKNIFNNGKIVFDVKQECDASDEVTYVGRASLQHQIKIGLFHGKKLCNGSLINTNYQDPHSRRFRHNTEYKVDLTKQDRFEVEYTPLTHEPSIPSLK